uniref:Zinc finger CCCH domain-containing protein 5 n=2 Tax=Cajanus cajan TaxID=3821 RepID=A0A151T875_CAJCA|nr:Zinc finger CCCH domain-containing protein 5 [Cajanus cajan]
MLWGGTEEKSNRKMEEGKSRKEKRKAMKKMKRKQTRREAAERERREEEERLKDPEEQRLMQLAEQQEVERMQRERILFEERERAWMERIIQKQDDLEEKEKEKEDQDEDEYQYVQDEGPPEIIWQGNEIIFKKKQLRVRVADKNENHQDKNNRPVSNPLPPESESQSQSQSESHTHMLQDVAQHIPNFGTEQDKAHCPFHLKTGACRFGLRCSRVHFYPDKSSTLLIKNMYNGPGLACDRDQDEGLEYTDEEVERCFEEFYEDVHTEFLKFGEIVNFKVCKNGSFHLRGNVYVQYKLLDSALLAYNSVNGRYFAGKQVSCQFVNLTRWKVAICGEYMKSGFKTCSHGTACNFIHCFRNPGGDYEWADSDKPPPKYWVKKMVALFGYSVDYETSGERGNLSLPKNISKTDSDRYHHSRRSRSREMDQLNCGHSSRRKQDERKPRTPDKERNANFKNKHKRKSRSRTPDADPDKELLEKEENKERHRKHTWNSSFNRNRGNNKSREEDSDVDWDTGDNGKQHRREGRNSRKWNRDIRVWISEAEEDRNSDRDDKMRHISKSKRSRHRSGDASESNKDLLGRGEMETHHDYSRKSSKHIRSGLQDDYIYYENENDKDDGGRPPRESYKREHRHNKKRSEH